MPEEQTITSHHETVTSTARIVRDVVDGNGLYFSRMATAGPYVFLGSTAVDASGRLAPRAVVPPPYHLSPAAHVVNQAEYIFEQYTHGLTQLGSTLDDLLQVEQFTPRKVYADGYIDTRSAFIPRGRPTTALACTGELVPQSCVINTTGIAVIPAGDLQKEIHAAPGDAELLATQWADLGPAFAEEGAFSEVVAAGPYVFVTGDVAVDWITGDIEESVKVPDWIWLGSEIRNEAEFLLTRLEAYLSWVGASLRDVVHTTVFLTSVEDLFELDRVWRRRFDSDPPARTVLPVRGLGVPRFEGVDLAHREKGVRMEQLPQAIRPGHGARKEVVSTGADPLGHESEAVKAGPLLWISQQYAGDRSTGRAAGDARSQIDEIFERLDAICRAGGTALGSLVRLRAFVTDSRDAYAVYAALKDAFPSDPPTVVVTAVPGPLLLPGAVVAVDAVAHVG